MAARLRFLASNLGSERWDQLRTRGSIENDIGMEAEVILSHLLNDSAAQRHVGTTEDIGHVSGHFQVILPIYTWDLRSKV